MNSPQFSGPDAVRSRLRSTVATLERAIAREPTDPSGKSPASGLVEAFADLVQQLALGPEPAVRECPVCKQVGMLAATRCGSCWAKLTPPAETETEGVSASMP